MASIGLKESIARQRSALAQRLAKPLADLAAQCAGVWDQREPLDRVLQAAITGLPYCKFLYVLDERKIQISDNVSQTGIIAKDFGRDRSMRPYMQQSDPDRLNLSEAYISLRARRPSLTAVHCVRDEHGRTLGYLGADFDLRDLPFTRELYDEPGHWRQLKGDPAIRGTVFAQSRTESALDGHIEEVLAVLEELMCDHGVFHTKLHFSSNRATVWLVNDPYRYRLLDIEALTDPDVCLVYPTRAYPQDAVLPQGKVRIILDRLRQLRFMDETFYLRSGSINIFNGMVSLTFSCDGSHYLPWEEFLVKDHSFWVGGAAQALP